MGVGASVGMGVDTGGGSGAGASAGSASCAGAKSAYVIPAGTHDASMDANKKTIISSGSFFI